MCFVDCQLDCDQLLEIGKLVKLKGTEGALSQAVFLLNSRKEKSTNRDLWDHGLFDDEYNDNKDYNPFSTEPDDYMHCDVGYVLDLVRFT